MADDVLDLDDGIVDQDAGDDGDAEQAHQIEREAEHVHRPEGRHDRERQRDGGDDGGADVAQEQEHHQHGQDGALPQGVQRRMEVAERVGCRAVDQFEGDVGIGLGQHLDLGRHLLRHLDVAGARRLVDRKGRGLLAVEHGKGGDVGGIGLDDGEVLERPLLAIADGDRHVAEHRGDLLGIAMRRLEAVGGKPCQLLADIDRHDLVLGNLARIERHRDFAARPAGGDHVGDAGELLDLGHGLGFDHRRQLLGRELVGAHGIGEPGRPGDLDELDARILEIGRQHVIGGGINPLHVGKGRCRLLVDRELDSDGSETLGDGRQHMARAVDRLEALFERNRHLLLEGASRRAGAFEQQHHHRDVDIRIAGDRHARIGIKADRHQENEQQRGRQRPPDRPGRDVEPRAAAIGHDRLRRRDGRRRFGIEHGQAVAFRFGLEPLERTFRPMRNRLSQAGPGNR